MSWTKTGISRRIGDSSHKILCGRGWGRWLCIFSGTQKNPQATASLSAFQGTVPILWPWQLNASSMACVHTMDDIRSLHIVIFQLLTASRNHYVKTSAVSSWDVVIQPSLNPPSLAIIFSITAWINGNNNVITWQSRVEWLYIDFNINNLIYVIAF